MAKPCLFIDIDGVVYGSYGGAWQVRPYVVTLTNWAKDHFDIYWVSFNSRKEQVVQSIYAHGKVVLTWGQNTLDDRGYRVRLPETWHPKADNCEKLIAINELCGIEKDWILIEDTPPHADQIEVLEHFKSLHKWVVVPDTGSDVLLDVKIMLEEWLKTRDLIVPFEWATREPEERDLCCNSVWKGYGKSGR